MTLHGTSVPESAIWQILLDGVSSRVVYEGNACDSYPCWNDALCLPVNTTTATYKCICREEFAGFHCQYKISDYCAHIKCASKTTCTVHDGTATCIANDLIVELDASLIASGMTSGTVLLLLSILFLICLSIMMICMSTSAGCYLNLPGETRYIRWESTFDSDDTPITDPGGTDSLPTQCINLVTFKNSSTKENEIDYRRSASI
uniref:EGF-like domain-containing protein n=1 Tax=Setaria digitata TaxID=48799 RepID=A0A915PKZ1_9BILA